MDENSTHYKEFLLLKEFCACDDNIGTFAEHKRIRPAEMSFALVCGSNAAYRAGISSVRPRTAREIRKTRAWWNKTINGGS